jgi:UDP-N-acetylmuramate--alanine ligase
MFNKDIIKVVYLIGIGGIGMSALARYFKFLGMNVMGYDRTPSALTDELISEGIHVHFDDNINIISTSCPLSVTLVIYTPAVPPDNPELAFFKTNTYNIKKRSEVLGLISESYRTIAIAGTHGKTTISTMTAHILKNSKTGCSAFLGGISKNYNTNFLFSASSEFMVTEADEYDRSFLYLAPSVAVITAVDADHLDIYNNETELKRSFIEFSARVKAGGNLIVKKDIGLQPEVKGDIKVFTYSSVGESDFYAVNIRLSEKGYRFDIKVPGGQIIRNLILKFPGRINVENAVAATAAAWLSGVNEDEIRKALSNFEGVKRRFDFIINTPDLVYIDDYAHHPVELRAAITSVRELYPGKRITGIFQPHLFTRTRDFAGEFASNLDLFDEMILLDIYPARELPVEGVTSKIIFDRMKLKNKTLCTMNEAMHLLSGKKPEVLITLGAGNIDRMAEPIKKMLLE